MYITIRRLEGKRLQLGVARKVTNSARRVKRLQLGLARKKITTRLSV